MFDSLPYRNDAAIVFRRLIRSLPTRRGVLGVATCDKGLPAMMLALAGSRRLAVRAGARRRQLAAERGRRRRQDPIDRRPLCARRNLAGRSRGAGLQRLRVAGRRLPVPGHGGHGASRGRSAWACRCRTRRSRPAASRSGSTWPAAAPRRCWRCTSERSRWPTFSPTPRSATRWSCTRPAAARPTCCCTFRPSPTRRDCGGRRSTTGSEINARVPRFVDALPNGPVGHPTVRVFLAGGVPEVMLHLRDLGLLDLDVLDRQRLHGWATCSTGGKRRRAARGCARHCEARDGVDPDDVIMSPARAAGARADEHGLFSARQSGARGRGHQEHGDRSGAWSMPTASIARRARRASSRASATPWRRSRARAEPPIRPGDVIVLIGRGPMGSGMEETYQITSALRYLEWGREVAVITDARFSGVSTGACIGHVGPEALAGGPIGKVREGRPDSHRDRPQSARRQHRPGGRRQRRIRRPRRAARCLAARPPRDDLAPDARLPDDTRLWAALQRASGGTWGGCVYDVERIVASAGSRRAGTGE